MAEEEPNVKVTWRTVSSIPKGLQGARSVDAKWGVASILLSVSLFLFPLSFAFWAMWVSLDGGRIMLPSNSVSWIFAGLAVVSFVAWIIVTVYMLATILPWYASSAAKVEREQREEQRRRAREDAQMALLTAIAAKLGVETKGFLEGSDGEPKSSRTE